jgi:twitching motility protein PilU
MLKILPYLKLAIEKSASDIYFTTGAPAMLRIEGDMHPVGKTLLTAEFIRELALSILTPEQQEYLQKHV